MTNAHYDDWDEYEDAEPDGCRNCGSFAEAIWCWSEEDDIYYRCPDCGAVE